MRFRGSSPIVLAISLVASLAACGDDGLPAYFDARPADADIDAAEALTFRLSGTVTYDYMNANDNVTEGSGGLDYGHINIRPVRRSPVLAIEHDAVLVQTITNDRGEFALDIPRDHTVILRVPAESSATGYAADGIAPDHCNAANWDVKVIDNTSGGAEYVLEGPSFGIANGGVALHAPLAYSGTAYTTRVAAPFALLDTVLTELELACEGQPDTNFPSLHVNWSVNNTNVAGDPSIGHIGATFYARDAASGQSNLFVLGKEDVDTDEYDDHVIAHELGHYFEDRLYRSDSPGGAHSAGDVLDPSVAFSEGFGNAIAGMTFNDPIYVDTSGVAQASVFVIQVDAKPVGDDRGVYSETSMQYLLWSLFDNRHPGHGTFERIANILASFHRTTPAMTSGLSFASYYNQVYGSAAEHLRALWATDLATPFNALCVGACAGSGDTADPFDADNDIGKAYAGTRAYPETTGPAFSAEFWRLYRTLADGANAATAHDVTKFGGYADSFNKLGAQRWYRYTATATGSTTISVGNLGASDCTTNVLDMTVMDGGLFLGFDQQTTGATAGCPSVQFEATAGRIYTIMVNGLTTELPSFDVTVAPKQGLGFTVTSLVQDRVAEDVDLTIPVSILPGHDCTNLTTTVRGIDGVLVRSGGGRHAFATCSRGAALRQAVVARVPAGTAGYLVVDVGAVVGGRPVRASYSIPLRGPSARFVHRTPGDIIVGTSGANVVRMLATSDL